MAVGAQAGAIFRMILGEGLKLSLTGLVLGLAGASLLGRAGSSLAGADRGRHRSLLFPGATRNKGRAHSGIAERVAQLM